MHTPPTPVDTVLEFRKRLANCEGRFVRVHTTDGEVHEGILVDAPEVYVDVGEDGRLVVRGHYVLNGPPSYVGNIEDICTYDVLPERPENK